MPQGPQPQPGSRRAHASCCHAALTMICVTLLVLIATPRSVEADGNHETTTSTDQTYSQRVAHTYSDPFVPGRHFLPSNMTTETGGFIDPATFPTAQYCGHCHKAAYRQWRESAHSNSNRPPWYLRNVDLLKHEKGVAFARHCEGCHDPVALVAGNLTPGSDVRHSFDDDGVTCSVCHSIQSVDARGTGSYVLGTPAVLLDAFGHPITHPVSDAEILEHLDRHSAAEMKPFYRTSEYCAACHKAALPSELNSYKWQRAFSVYDEWQNSAFSKQSPLPFYQKAEVSTCQTCHMQREPLEAPDPGAKSGKLASHRWLGANTVIPQYYGFDEQARQIVAYLRNGLFSIDFFALEHGDQALAALSAGPQAELTAPLGSQPFHIASGELLVADIVIQNRGIAHSLVPEQRDMYQAWVDFTLTDKAGHILKESGFIDPKTGELDPRAHTFTNRLINNNGSLNREHQVWDTRIVAYNNTIQSGHSELVRYAFHMPPASIGSITLTATIKYRRFNQHFMDFGMNLPAGKHYTQPIVSMASSSITFATGENAAYSSDIPEWMRWNNYGIALLDLTQYDTALQAFSNVIRLRPDYADGYTNRALAEISWQKYNDAADDLTHALTLAPDNMRALYYRAILERTQGRLDAAIADFENVIRAYPRSRDAHRELGATLSQQHKYDEARDQYLAVQSIDPDDLAAHYNLAILYRRLGDKAASEREAAQFAQEKDDPNANPIALAYLRSHPATANEAALWHAHNLDAGTDHPQSALPTTFTATEQ